MTPEERLKELKNEIVYEHKRIEDALDDAFNIGVKLAVDRSCEFMNKHHMLNSTDLVLEYMDVLQNGYKEKDN